MFTPTKDGIFFTFVEDSIDGRFVNSTSSIIVTSSSDKKQLIPRWAKVLATGPNVVDVMPDDYILIETGKWTEGIPFNNIKFWKTNEEFVMLISDKAHSTY